MNVNYERDIIDWLAQYKVSITMMVVCTQEKLRASLSLQQGRSVGSWELLRPRGWVPQIATGAEGLKDSWRAR